MHNLLRFLTAYALAMLGMGLGILPLVIIFAATDGDPGHGLFWLGVVSVPAVWWAACYALIQFIERTGRG